jgi:hypothetical protein
MIVTLMPGLKSNGNNYASCLGQVPIVPALKCFLSTMRACPSRMIVTTLNNDSNTYACPQE